MILFSGFLEVILRSLAIIGLVLAIGGIVFSLVVLRPWRLDRFFSPEALDRTLRIVMAGSVVIAVSQTASLLITPWALADEFGRWPVGEFLLTRFAFAGIIHSALAVLLVITTAVLMKHVGSLRAWIAEVVAALMLLASGAWLVHAVSRLEDALSLMTITILHQLGAAVWIGGVAYLLLLQRFMRDRAGYSDWWPVAVSRFSPFALSAATLLVLAGLYLAVSYINTWTGMVGTAYGAMVLTKIVLLGAALAFGALNFFSIRQWNKYEIKRFVMARTPVSLEAEALLGLIILLGAVALTSQPPSIDILSDVATPAEVASVFTPKIPQLAPPPYREMLSQAASSFDPFAITSALDHMQSNFNHNVSGLIVLLTGIGALLFRSGKAPWARHWPLLFLLLALFLLVYAEPTGWPLGNEPFWGALIVPGVLQHRLATVLVIGLAVFEWRVRAGALAGTRWEYAFPLLCVAGGGLLLTHSHTAFALKQAFLMEVSHDALAVLAVFAGIGRLLEIRFPSPENRVFGYIWPFCLVGVALALLFYRES